MRSRRFLLIPGNNSLSHVAKGLVVREALVQRGHEAAIAVSRRHVGFLRTMGVDHFVLPDIQENDESGFPSVEWFRQPRPLINCINAEAALLKAFQPDRVLGVFRFTLKVSARIAGIPYDSLACGCMIPDSDEVLGFAPGEPGRENQRMILDGFFRYAGLRADAACSSLGVAGKSEDIRHMLKGERTFLWDFPEFAPMEDKQDLIHVGPLSWNQWPYDPFDTNLLADDKERPLAVVAFGTCTVCRTSAERIMKVLLDLGYRILLAAGGQTEFLNIMRHDPRVMTYTFAPLHEILPHAALLVTHGGQMTVFEALQNQVPVVVMPFQPEQAHSGLCLERLGCGVRLVPPQSFQGNPAVYMDALDRMTDDDISAKISELVHRQHLGAKLARAKEIFGRYKGVEAIVDSLVEACS